MAAITFDGDLVQLSVGDVGTTGRGIALETIQQGWPVAISSGGLIPAESNSSQPVANAVGIALSLGQQDQQVSFAMSGVIDFGTAATLVQGRAYYVGTGGQIVPEGDLPTGRYVTLLGIAQSTRLLLLSINATGILRS